MNRLAAILPASNVLVDVDATSKKRVFEHAGLLFENQHAIARATVTDNLFARERLGSTGLGHGVAIPHGRIKGLKNPLAAVARVVQPIPFDAPDDEAVSLLIFLLVPESAGQVIDVVRGYLGQLFAERTTRHGVFMDILGLGVLLTGESGLGKSELGLELISRGHGLVADDAVDIYRMSQTALEGRCPELLLNLLEVRGIGLLDIKAIFGETAVRRKMRVKLIVHLVRKETLEREFERLPYEPLYERILDVPVRKAVIAVDAGRNLAVLVEAAVRNTILQLRGIDTYKEFIERHQRALERGPD